MVLHQTGAARLGLSATPGHHKYLLQLVAHNVMHASLRNMRSFTKLRARLRSPAQAFRRLQDRALPRWQTENSILLTARLAPKPHIVFLIHVGQADVGQVQSPPDSCCSGPLGSAHRERCSRPWPRLTCFPAAAAPAARTHLKHQTGSPADSTDTRVCWLAHMGGGCVYVHMHVTASHHASRLQGADARTVSEVQTSHRARCSQRPKTACSACGALPAL
jgi:hypothetical protein